MKKKVLAGVVTAMLSATSIVPSYVSAEGLKSTWVANDNLVYSLYDEDENGTYDTAVVTSLESLLSKKDTYEILSEVNGCPVKRIEENAFIDANWVTGITMPDTIEELGANAFSGCTSLTNVRLSENLKEIPEKCFFNCSDLEGVSIPDSVEVIGTGAFASSGLASVDMPANLTEIGENAFSTCLGLGVVNFDTDSQYTIGNYAFYECQLLESVHLTDDVTKVGNSAFGLCISLEDVKLAGIKEVSRSCFLGCTDLQAITIPKEVEIVHDNAFISCASLSDIRFENPNCVIRDITDLPKRNGLAIYGYKNSTAEEYATKYLCDFIAIDEEPVVTEPIVTTTVTTTTTSSTTTTTVTTTKATTTAKVTTTEATTATDGVVDSQILYGDVNLDKLVSLADIVVVTKYNVSRETYPIRYATAKENADCHYDHVIDSLDTQAMIEYNLHVLDLDDLGKQDKSDLPNYN